MFSTNNGICIVSFATVIYSPVGRAIASFSYAFLLTITITKKLSKTTRNKEKKHNKLVILARSKLFSIESKIPEAFIDYGISHEDFTTITNKEKNYCELKEIIRIMKRQRSDAERSQLIKEGKRMGGNEIIRQNNLKPQV